LRLWASRIVLTALACAGGYLLWSLTYALVVGARFDPKLPGEGAARWALLQSLNHGALLDILTRSADHLWRRLAYPPTQAETAVRGALALGLTLALGAGLAIAAWVTRPSTLHGAARWGTLLDAERRKLTKKRGLVLGKLGGATIASDEPGHVLVVGPTRSGKGQSFIVPNGVMWEGSMIVFDPKRENFALFGAWREAKGDAVFLFHPGEARSHRYNPLDFVRTGDAMPTDALVVAGFIVPDTPGEVWGKSARLLLAALIAHIVSVFASSLTMVAYGVPLASFYDGVLNTVDLEDVFSGLTKSVLFGIVIAAVGCMRGMQTGTGAAAVGISATRAVVSSIVMIVLVDGVFAYISYKTDF
jgi:type IV secretion system protein VirD4